MTPKECADRIRAVSEFPAAAVTTASWSYGEAPTRFDVMVAYVEIRALADSMGVSWQTAAEAVAKELNA